MRLLFGILFFGMALGCYGQIKLEGIVKDSLSLPLELANVIAINQATNAMASYGITNDSGRFKIELGVNGTYQLQISYVGMKTLKQTIETTESDLYL